MKIRLTPKNTDIIWYSQTLAFSQTEVNQRCLKKDGMIQGQNYFWPTFTTFFYIIEISLNQQQPAFRNTVEWKVHNNLFSITLIMKTYFCPFSKRLLYLQPHKDPLIFTHRMLHSRFSMSISPDGSFGRCGFASLLREKMSLAWDLRGKKHKRALGKNFHHRVV